MPDASSDAELVSAPAAPDGYWFGPLARVPRAGVPAQRVHEGNRQQRGRTSSSDALGLRPGQRGARRRAAVPVVTRSSSRRPRHRRSLASTPPTTSSRARALRPRPTEGLRRPPSRCSTCVQLESRGRLRRRSICLVLRDGVRRSSGAAPRSTCSTGSVPARCRARRGASRSPRSTLPFAVRHLEDGETFDAATGVLHERATLRDAGRRRAGVRPLDDVLHRTRGRAARGVPRRLRDIAVHGVAPGATSARRADLDASRVSCSSARRTRPCAPR